MTDWRLPDGYPEKRRARDPSGLLELTRMCWEAGHPVAMERVIGTSRGSLLSWSCACRFTFSIQAYVVEGTA